MSDTFELGAEEAIIFSAERIIKESLEDRRFNIKVSWLYLYGFGLYLDWRRVDRDICEMRAGIFHDSDKRDLPLGESIIEVMSDRFREAEDCSKDGRAEISITIREFETLATAILGLDDDETVSRGVVYLAGLSNRLEEAGAIVDG
jgi:hypothetical protein